MQTQQPKTHQNPFAHNMGYMVILNFTLLYVRQ